MSEKGKTKRLLLFNFWLLHDAGHLQKEQRHLLFSNFVFEPTHVLNFMYFYAVSLNTLWIRVQKTPQHRAVQQI